MLKCVFYQYSSPKWLRRLMTLPPIKAKYLPKHIRPKELHDDTLVRFQVRVIPMGWTWSVLLVAKAQEAWMQLAAPLHWLYDHQVVPTITEVKAEGASGAWQYLKPATRRWRCKCGAACKLSCGTTRHGGREAEGAQHACRKGTALHRCAATHMCGA